MKYIIPFLFVALSFLTSCADEKNSAQLQREQTRQVNDSILNMIHNNWNFNIPSSSSVVKKETLDWQNWQVLLQELANKPTKSLLSYRAKVDNLTRISDELLLNKPENLNKPQINARLNNLNTNIKHLNSFISLQTIPVDKVKKLVSYISIDVVSIQNQIDKFTALKNIPFESGEKEMIEQVTDTTRRANFNFENKLKEEPKLKTLDKRRGPLQLKDKSSRGLLLTEPVK